MPIGDPTDTSQQILQVLSSLRPGDPSAINPATSEAMARSRDTVTKLLQRQLSRIDSPFSGLSDVATAAEGALLARKPFGQTMEDLGTNRVMKATQIANTLGSLASKEASAMGRGATTPYQSAQLAMSQLRFLAQRGDKDAQMAEKAIDNIRTSLDPEDAVGFVVDAHSALQSHQRQIGRSLTGQEAVAVISNLAQSSNYRTRRPNLQRIVNPVTGETETFDPRPYGGGGVSGMGRVGIDEAPIPNRASPMPSAPVYAQDAAPPPGATTTEPVLGGKVPLPPVNRSIPPVVAKPALMGIPDTANRLDSIIRARDTATNVPGALGLQGALIDSIGGFIQQAERAIGAPGALGSEKLGVNEISRARDTMNMLFGKLIPTVTGDSSGRYSNFDVRMAERMTRFRSAASSPEQVVGFFNLMRDMEVRALRRQLSLAGPGGRAIYETLSPEVKSAMENPAIVGPDGEAPYDDVKIDGRKLYVRQKGTQNWFEVQK